MERMLEPGGRVLLVAVDHDLAEVAGRPGPPHSLREEEVRTLFEPRGFVVRLLERSDRLPFEARWQKMGSQRFDEVVYLLTKRQC
jgi:hypothetical protein